MITARAVFVLLALTQAASACRAPATPAIPTRAEDPAKPALASDDPPPREGPSLSVEALDPYDGPLVVGGEGGLVVLDERGLNPVTITSAPSMLPRWLRPGEVVLVLRPIKDRWSLVEVDIARRSERVVIDDLIADAADCPEGAPETEEVEDAEDIGEWMAVQEATDFVVSGQHQLACVSMMDRNANMANVRVQTKVGLASRVVSRITEIAFHCDSDQSHPPDAACDRLRLSVNDSSSTPKPLEPYRVDGGALIVREDGNDRVVAGPFPAVDHEGNPDENGECGLPSFFVDSVSPSGRWAVLLGNESMGDYFHSEWMLMDVHEGQFYVITEAEWPAPVARDQLDRVFSLGNDVVAESTFLWISGDRLLVDQLLVSPGESVVELPGDLVR